MNYNTKLRFWPWMWAENKAKVGVPLIFIIVSVINLSKGNIDKGFIALYTIAFLSVITSLIGIIKHWKLLKKLEAQNKL